MSKKVWLAGCAWAAVWGFAGASLAQQMPPSPTSEHTAEAERPSEIIVTATRRSTALERTPLAVTAISGAAVDSQRLYTIGDVAQKTPGLIFNANDRQEAYLSIRGTTVNNDAAGSNLGVSVFIDDVPTTGIGDNNPDLFDLRSIEVLRGPQGTLFGQNVTGGALVIHTAPPSFTDHFSVQGTYGSNNLAEVRAFVTGPIIPDVLAGKLTVETRHQDGILDNVTLHQDVLSTSVWSTRGQLLWTPTSKLKVLFGLDYTDDSSPYKAQQLIGNFIPTLFPTLSYNPNDANQGMRTQASAKIGGGLVHIDYETPVGTLTSISGYRTVNDHLYFSTSAEPNNELLQHAVNIDDQETEELRLASPSNQRLTWVGGLFYLNSHHKLDKTFNLNITPGTLVSFVDPYSALTFDAVQDQTIRWQSYAAFGEANYHFTEKLELTVGGRYTDEQKSGHSIVTDTSGLSPALVTPRYSHSWSGFTPKVSLSYQATPNLLTYVTYATGFKSGGYDLSGTTVQALETPFRPEKVKSYEAGAKYTAFQNRLILNVAAYYADYTDLQVQQFDQSLLQFVTANAGRAKLPGVELEAEVVPFDWLSLKGSYSYSKSEYTKYVTPDGDYSHNQIPFTAKNHLNLGADIHFISPQLGGGELRFGGDVTFQSKRFFTDQNNEIPLVVNNTPISGLLNLRASWTSADNAWVVSIYGKNVTDKRYLIYATDLTPFYATPGEYFGGVDKMYDTNWSPPAEFGVTITFKR